MLFNRLLYISLLFFLIGSVFRASRWFVINIGSAEAGFSATERIKSALFGSIKTVFSGDIIKALMRFFADALLQLKVVRTDFIRWLMHALDSQITEAFLPDYQSTLNPFFFLRNLMGLMVLAGLTAAGNLARQGFVTHLVEKSDRLGGQAHHILETWKSEPVAEHLSQLAQQVQSDPQVRIYLNARINKVEGSLGALRPASGTTAITPGSTMAWPLSPPAPWNTSLRRIFTAPIPTS